jgi:protein-disulfide isomerase
MLRKPVDDSDHIQGDASAPLVLVEYGDFECPHCAHAHPVVKRLQEHFGDQLAFVFRNFPLREIHPMAEPAAEAAEYAATKNKFWEMHDLIFEHQKTLDGERLIRWGEKLGLDAQDLGKALSEGAFEPAVSEDFSSGVRSGVNGTPTFFINGTRHDGSPTFDDLADALREARRG